MMLDFDGLKGVNDQHGHEAGDQALQKMAKVISDTIRAYDVACRVGGDEFIIICTQTSLSAALPLAERVRANVEKMVCKFSDGGEWRGSVSVGVAALTGTIGSASELLATADDHAYKAKMNGRNRIEFT